MPELISCNECLGYAFNVMKHGKSIELVCLNCNTHKVFFVEGWS